MKKTNKLFNVRVALILSGTLIATMFHTSIFAQCNLSPTGNAFFDTSDGGGSCSYVGDYVQGDDWNGFGASNPVLTIDGDLTITGNFTIYDDIIINGTLTVTGNITLDNAATIDVNGDLDVDGGMTTGSFSNFTVDGDADIDGALVIVGVLNVNDYLNVGSLDINSGVLNVATGSTLDIDGNFTNGGIVDIPVLEDNAAGTINVGGNFTNEDGGHLNVSDGGVIDVDGTIVNDNGGSLDIADGGTINADGGITDNDPGPGIVVDGANPDGTCTDGCCGAVCGSLPVELYSFDGEVIFSQEVLLTWTTASELNNEGFYVEKSTDGVNFHEIGFVQGNGTTNEFIDYEFVDQYASGLAYYRLYQVDYDGQSEYHKVIRVALDQGQLIQVYPNPFASEIHLNGPSDVVYTMALIDASNGTRVAVSRGNLREIEAGLNKIVLGLNTATYVLSLTEPTGKASQHRIIKR